MKYGLKLNKRRNLSYKRRNYITEHHSKNLQLKSDALILKSDKEHKFLKSLYLNSQYNVVLFFFEPCY